MAASGRVSQLARQLGHAGPRTSAHNGGAAAAASTSSVIGVGVPAAAHARALSMSSATESSRHSTAAPGASSMPPQEEATRSTSPASASTTSGDASKSSFIDRVKVMGAQAMLGVFLSTGTRFDRVLEGMRVTRVGDGEIECELTVHDGLQNSYSSLHGGATMTIVDVVGTMALLTRDATRAGVSVDVSVSFTAAAKAGERVRIVGRVLRSGKRLAFTAVDLFRAEDGTLIASGRHTKAL